MKKRSKIIFGSVTAVILSTTLIACGVHRHHSDPAEKMDYIAEKIEDRLDLTPEQVTQLNVLKDEVLVIVKEAKAKRADTHQEIENLLSQPTLDQSRLLTLVQEKTEAVNTKAPTVIAALAGFYDSLNPEQQAELLEKFQDHKERHRGWFHH